jgi:hypothetical protein
MLEAVPDLHRLKDDGMLELMSELAIDSTTDSTTDITTGSKKKAIRESEAREGEQQNMRSEMGQKAKVGTILTPQRQIQ